MLVIGNKKYRNLQEQVGWNTEQIDKIFEFLDGINVSDNVVVVLDISTPLTTEELEIVNREVAFIVYNGELYFKRNQDSTYIYFDVVFSVSGSTVITLTSSEITVTKSNGALGITNSSASTYSKSEVDSLLSGKADTSYVSSQLALKANLTGANFTGAITAPSIIEDMSGYGASLNTIAGLTIEKVYVGVVKNGNKITFVFAVNFTKTDAALSVQQKVGSFIIPSSIGDKLYESSVGLYEFLDNKVVPAWDSYTSKVDIISYIDKVSSTAIDVYIFNVDDLVVNTKYYYRYEATFLLSDDIAS